jgi:hypothetical protein
MNASTDLTLIHLLTFRPLNDIEKELFNFDKKIIDEFLNDLKQNRFYLGGQLKMKADDFINVESIQQVREINLKRNIDYGGPCNFMELQSMRSHLNKLEFVENMIIKYNIIRQIRENTF